MGKNIRRDEKGISLLFSMLALMLLSAVAAGMMFMASTESSINGNFKAEETVYFAARAGVEEVRDRMLKTNPNTINCTGQVQNCGLLPQVLPSTSGGVLYILQNGVTMANVTNVTSSNPLADDELCHDFPYSGNGYGGMTPSPANVRCTNLPSGSSWYTTTPSVAPYPLEYKWVRVTLKAANSTSYPVDPTQPAATNQVCWNGTSEVLLSTGTASCNAMTPIASPVYLVTSLAVTPSGARRLVQQEISQTPVSGLPYGAFATGTGCGALSMSGGATTHSFNSAAENPPTNPPSNVTNSNGNVGSNGNLTFSGGTAVNGTAASSKPGVGNCNQGNGITVSGGASYSTASTIPVQTLPVPPLPNPLPPQRSQNINSSTTLAPGAYGDLKIQGGATVTLQGGTSQNPAVYTLNSLSLSGGSTLVITGPVVLDIAGVGANNAVDFSGGDFSNTSYVPSNFVINYGGHNNINLSGGAAAYAVINAPNANVSFSGGSNFYGQVIGATIADSGGTSFYYDSSLSTPVQNTKSFYEVSLRELSY